ncbi:MULTISPECIES: hypothetical protein [unclassified Cupriavidus]|uniref:hypothetical protein n=1 Tax=unclassified Cupriavidus TaxID=2640874 RepID=UPI000890D9D9|nr:hypothetical protein [Cupriavidus sp. YR651]SDC48806.1 hypothetical protein SAMN05216345_102485 [Cupriavidus sp. YR651]
MDTSPSANYKGYDIYPLIYTYHATREWYERRPDRTYSASVVICKEGQDPASDQVRLFPMLSNQWDSLGGARRAAVQAGEDIIDGFVPGQSITGL